MEMRRLFIPLSRIKTVMSMVILEHVKHWDKGKHQVLQSFSRGKSILDLAGRGSGGKHLGRTFIGS